MAISINKPPSPGNIYVSNKYNKSISNEYKVLTWNILRGYKYKDISRYIQSINADIVMLQEVDWGNERTDNLNIVHEIAKETKMNYVFATQFEEIKTWRRNLSRKAGQGGGVIGNAILSRYKLLDPYAFKLETRYLSSKFIPTRATIRKLIGPIKGSCVALAASIETTSYDKIKIYSTHLEISKAGLRTRIEQFKQIYLDSIDEKYLVIGGDFNTAAHGAFAFYNALENMDAFYMKSVFTPEAKYWEENIIPSTNLIEPFDKTNDWTLKVGNIYYAKLDWLLTRGFIRHNNIIGPAGLSDHRSLISSVLIK